MSVLHAFIQLLCSYIFLIHRTNNLDGCQGLMHDIVGSECPHEGQKVLKVTAVVCEYSDNNIIDIYRGDSMHHCDALSEPRLCNYVHWAFFKYCFIFWTIGLYTSQPSSLDYLECTPPSTHSAVWIIQGGSPTAVFSYRQASFKWQLVHELPVPNEQQQIGLFCTQFHHCNNTLLNTCLCTFIIIEKWNTKLLL